MHIAHNLLAQVTRMFLRDQEHLSQGREVRPFALIWMLLCSTFPGTCRPLWRGFGNVVWGGVNDDSRPFLSCFQSSDLCGLDPIIRGLSVTRVVGSISATAAAACGSCQLFAFVSSFTHNLYDCGCAVVGKGWIKTRKLDLQCWEPHESNRLFLRVRTMFTFVLITTLPKVLIGVVNGTKRNETKPLTTRIPFGRIERSIRCGLQSEPHFGDGLVLGSPDCGLRTTDCCRLLLARPRFQVTLINTFTALDVLYKVGAYLDVSSLADDGETEEPSKTPATSEKATRPPEYVRCRSGLRSQWG
ncbi:hypothetical protein FA15DRAFT_358911 [Coprinopsis marcescibilis]|uniref:Uncharacterized protein n=1 Tax=Coprinopsis marcescibilis TaxID=230819 RepID=A0A5C3KB76_COPMA|nr:hypothetical protein FA15DRAFT_358911 [Coprinopsis marcescibilis]